MLTPPRWGTRPATILTTRRFGDSGAKNQFFVSGKQYELIYSKEQISKTAESYARIMNITPTKCIFEKMAVRDWTAGLQGGLVDCHDLGYVREVAKVNIFTFMLRKRRFCLLLRMQRGAR